MDRRSSSWDRVVVLVAIGLIVRGGAPPHAAGLQSGEAPEWAEVIEWEADPSVVVDASIRGRIAEAGLPWRVRDRASGIEMLLVVPGRYSRGAAPDDPYDRANERPQHEVVLTRAFYLGRYEVTNAEYRRWAPDHDSGPFPRDSSLSLDGERYPVVQVSWEEATAFAEHFGLRLPTEAEWEYAARAGVTTRYPWGNDIAAGAGWGNGFNQAVKERIPEMDWDAFSWDDGWVATAPAGSFRPNAWGFHDMFGNVWESVADSFDPGLYESLPARVTDPLYDVGGGRTLRGGGFGNAPRGSGIPYRYGMDADSRHFGNGFRVARSVAAPQEAAFEGTHALSASSTDAASTYSGTTTIRRTGEIDLVSQRWTVATWRWSAAGSGCTPPGPRATGPVGPRDATRYLSDP